MSTVLLLLFYYLTHHLTHYNLLKIPLHLGFTKKFNRLKIKFCPPEKMVMCLRSPSKIPHEGGKYTHKAHVHTINQCRLMTVLMGKCTGFPQGHQGPERFNWQDQILLPFPASSSPSLARDNAVCILIHQRVSHSS